MKASNHILLTGAAGFIGFHVAERLLNQGIPVLGVDRMDSTYAPEIKQKNLHDLQKIAQQHKVPFEFCNMDICTIEPDFAAGTLQGVIHLAGRAGVRQSAEEPESYTQSNVLGTLRILELCRRQQPGPMLFASSSSVYGKNTPPPFAEKSPADHPISLYAASKRAAELYCITYADLYALRIAILRFFTVYGPRQRPLLAIHHFSDCIEQERELPMFGDGSSQRSYTYIDDIVDGVLAAWEHLQKQPAPYCDTFNLGSAQTVSLREMIEILEKAMGKKARIAQKAEQAGDMPCTMADLQHSEKILNYKPKTRFAEGVQRFVAWHRQRPRPAK